MNYQRFIITVTLLFCFATSKGQTDSSFLKEYPYLIGNLAFAVDSMETPVGTLSQGTDTTFRVAIYNAGEKTIRLFAGKSNKFVDLTYATDLIAPKKKTFAMIHLHILRKLLPGTMRFEAAFKTDDKKNPYKFLYFSAIIKKAENNFLKKARDNVPQLSFDNYLYDFGHLRRGRNFYYTFTFSNSGSKVLVIDRIEVDKGLEIKTLPPKVIPAGSYGSLRIKIKGRHYLGVFHKTIRVYSNDPANPVLTLGIHGTIKEIPSRKNHTDYCIDE